MKSSSSVLSAFLAALVCTSVAVSQWARTGGPSGGDPRAIEVSGTTIFAATVEGVTLSSDSGQTWTIVTPSQNAYPFFECLALDDSDVFAGTIGFGVYRSSDRGVTWAEANSGLTMYIVEALAISHPRSESGAIVFAGTSTGVFRSTNSGASWTAASAGLTNRYVEALVLADTSLYAGTDDGIFLSTDNGTTWGEVSPGLDNRIMALVRAGAGLLAGTDDGVFILADNAASWEQVGLKGLGVSSFAASGSRVYAGTWYNGVFSSTDSGLSWSGIPTQPGCPDIYALAIAGPNLVAGTDCGTFVSPDGGASWARMGVGEFWNIYCLAVSPSGIFAASDQGMFRSTNGGTSWGLLNTGAQGSAHFAVAVNGTNVYAGTDSGGALRSTDNGTTWSSANAGLAGTSVVNALAFAGATLLAGTPDGVFVSTDSARTWSGTDLTSVNVGAFALLGKTLFAATPGSVFVSPDSGRHWTTTGAVMSGVKTFAVLGDNLFAGTANSVVRSTDNGATWTTVYSGLPGTAVTALVAGGTNLFAATQPSDLFVSADNGTSWTDVSNGLVTNTSNNFGSLAVMGNSLLAGWGRSGVWRRPLSEMMTSAKQLSNRLPVVFELHQNYPNPFNPSTTIMYELPRTSNVKVTVFDILGHEVALLVNGRTEAGIHDVTFDGSNLASGIYFYRLQAGDFTQTKRCVILK